MAFHPTSNYSFVELLQTPEGSHNSSLQVSDLDDDNSQKMLLYILVGISFCFINPFCFILCILLIFLMA